MFFMNILNATDPTNISLINSYNSTYSFNINVQDNFVFIKSFELDLVILDLNDEFEIQNQYTFDQDLIFSDFCFKDNYFLVSSRKAGFQIYDIKDPTNIALIGNSASIRYVSDLEINNDFLYLASGSKGFEVLDLKKPVKPSEIRSLSDGGFANDLCLNGTLAFVADGFDGLEVYNVSNPAFPVKIGQLSSIGIITKIIIVKSNVFVTNNTNGIIAINLTNPKAPRIINEFSFSNESIRDIAVYDNTLYLVHHSTNGILLVNVSDLANPKTISTVYLSHDISKITISEKNLYIKTEEFLISCDISNTTNPVTHNKFNLDGTAYDIRKSGDLLFVSTYKLLIFNVTFPANPALIAGVSYNHIRYYGCAKYKDFYFTARANKGLVIYNGDKNANGIADYYEQQLKYLSLLSIPIIIGITIKPIIDLSRRIKQKKANKK